MNGLFLNSTSLSLASSSEPRSIVSDPTTSSSDGTAEGIGSLGGRALYAFGEAALRGFENLAIRRKLRSIKSLFPHDDTDTTKGVERIYDDVLELSRCVRNQVYSSVHHELSEQRSIMQVWTIPPGSPEAGLEVASGSDWN